MATSKILYTQTSPVGQTATTGQWEDMKGLALTLPTISADEKVALVILDVPNPYAIGTNYPGSNFAIKVNSVVDPTLPIACFTYSIQSLPGSAGRCPTTLVVRIKLGKKPIPIQAAWQSVRQSTVIVDTPCTLSAIIGGV
jgi:hypothetical protein